MLTKYRFQFFYDFVAMCAVGAGIVFLPLLNEFKLAFHLLFTSEGCNIYPDVITMNGSERSGLGFSRSMYFTDS